MRTHIVESKTTGRSSLGAHRSLSGVRVVGVSFALLLDSKSREFGYNGAGQDPGPGKTDTQSGPR